MSIGSQACRFAKTSFMTLILPDAHNLLTLRVFRRLAQNREVARRSRFRKKDVCPTIGNTSCEANTNKEGAGASQAAGCVGKWCIRCYPYGVGLNSSLRLHRFHMYKVLEDHCEIYVPKLTIRYQGLMSPLQGGYVFFQDWLKCYNLGAF